jgi:hypothetical protein
LHLNKVKPGLRAEPSPLATPRTFKACGGIREASSGEASEGIPAKKGGHSDINPGDFTREFFPRPGTSGLWKSETAEHNFIN